MDGLLGWFARGCKQGGCWRGTNMQNTRVRAVESGRMTRSKGVRDAAPGWLKGFLQELDSGEVGAA